MTRILSIFAISFLGIFFINLSGAAQEPIQSEFTETGSGSLQILKSTHLDHDEKAHALPFAPVLLQISLIITIAMLGRWVAIRFKQSGVLGELLIGVIIGNIGYLLGLPLFVLIMQLGEAIPLLTEVWLTGQSVTEAAIAIFPPEELKPGSGGERLIGIMTGLDGPRHVATGFGLWMFSELGVILLLFMVGLGTRVDEMLSVGKRALGVAVIGITVPFFLGLGTVQLLLPDSELPVQIFVAATLCVTSVGITARVLRDLGKQQSLEAKIILGAAVVDDVLGLIILAVVVGMATTGQVDMAEAGRIFMLAALFLGFVLFLGGRFVKLLIPVVTILEKNSAKLLFPLALAFFMAWLASAIELAPIVGAFAAGLILTEEHFEKTAPNLTMENLLSPLERIFAPVFFVIMGMQVNLQSFINPTTVWLALAFTVVAGLGKMTSGMVAGRDLDRLSVGFGMVPRGEVGLIMASIGKASGILTGAVFSAIVVTVIATTFITPITLRWSFSRKKGSPISP